MTLSRSLAVLGLMFSLTGPLAADEIKGKVKSVDNDKNEITLTVGDADQILTVASDAKFTGLFGKNAKKATTQEIKKGLKGVKEGADVVLETEAKDGKTTVTQVKVEGLQQKEKGKAKGNKKKQAN